MRKRERRAPVDRVSPLLRTEVPGIWAIGDCNRRGAFTHTSYNDYEIVAANLFDDDPRRVSDRILCYGLYIDPPLGRVGMTERQAQASGRRATAKRSWARRSSACPVTRPYTACSTRCTPRRPTPSSRARYTSTRR